MKRIARLVRAAACLFGLLLWLQGPLARAQAPAWQLALAAGSGSISEAYGTATDASGNVYIGGSFRGTTSFGTTTLTSAGGYDLFVAKYSPALGNFEWAVRTGGFGYDEVRAVAVSSSGIYVAGFTQSALINFGPSTLGATAGSDGFVAKLTPAGAWVWAEPISGDGTDEAFALTAAGANVYVGGYFTSNNVTFGAVQLTNTGTINAGYSDGFVARLTDAGSSASFGWAQRVGGTNNDQVRALAVAGNSVFVAGSFRLSAAFGSLSATSAGLQDVFLAKLLDNGSTSQFAWVQRAGGSSDDVVTAAAVSGQQVYLAGYFDSPTASFGPSTLSRAGDYDAFVAQLTDAGTAGSFRWAQRMGGTNDDRAYGLVAGPAGVAVAGYFSSNSASFGSLALTNYGGNGAADIFVTRLTDGGAAGAFAWAQRAGGTGSDQAFALTLHGATLYVAGTVSPQAIFAPLVINGPVATRIPLLAALSDPTLITSTAAKADLSFSIAPNPATGTIQIQLPFVLSATTATLTLRDLQGRVLRQATWALPVADRPQQWSLHGLSAGVYLLQLHAGQATAVQRLVVE